VSSLIKRIFERYCYYYALNNHERCHYVLHSLKERARNDSDMSSRLEYINSFQIVEDEHILIGGNVRDVSRGRVFIHERWTDDPWLLAGLAVRRAPWVFDPRYLKRPFYYRKQANVLMTQFVLESARYYPPFAVYQFGQQIVLARYGTFYSAIRRLGIELEPWVREDGTFEHDSMINWLRRRLGWDTSNQKRRRLWSDDEVIDDILQRCGEKVLPSPAEIALSYTYPAKYVEEVLHPRLNRALGHTQTAALSETSDGPC
jgi:hypothetical protein